MYSVYIQLSLRDSEYSMLSPSPPPSPSLPLTVVQRLIPAWMLVWCRSYRKPWRAHSMS